jgi:hypothetical protein
MLRKSTCQAGELKKIKKWKKWIFMMGVGRGDKGYTLDTFFCGTPGHAKILHFFRLNLSAGGITS